MVCSTKKHMTLNRVYTMFLAIAKAFVKYHRGLGKMPLAWKPWLISLLLANMIAGPVKVARLAKLAAKADIMICVDHVDQVEPISSAMMAAGQTVRVLIGC